MKLIRSSARAWLGVLALLYAVGTAHAATRSKANNTTALDNTNSWVGFVIPGSADTARWDNTVQSPNASANINNTLTWGQLQFVDPGIDFVINPGNPINLNGVAGVGIDMSAATKDLSIRTGVNLSGAQAWDVPDGRTLNIGVSGNGTTLSSSSGAASLTKTGGGTLILNGSGGNTQSSPILVLAGSLNLNKDAGNNTAIQNGGLTIGNATSAAPTSAVVRLTGASFNLVGGSAITVNKTGVLDTMDHAETLDGAVTLYGTNDTCGVVTNSVGGVNTVVFGSTVTFVGGGAVDLGAAATIQLNNSVIYTNALDGRAVSIAGNVTLNPGTLTFAVADDVNLPVELTISAVMGGNSIAKSGAGKLLLVGNNTYGGSTTISGGTLQVGTNGTSGNIQNGGGDIINNAHLIFSRSDALTYFATISGSGTVVQDGSGTLTLQQANTFTGNVTVAQGTIVAGIEGDTQSSLGNPSVARTVTIQSGATIRITQNDLWGNHLSSPAATYVVSGLLHNSGVFNTLRNLTLNGGELRANGGADPAFPAWQLKGTVTVGGSSVSRMTAPGSVNGNTQIHLGNNAFGSATIFTVTDATGDSAADLTVANALVNGRDSGDFVPSGLTKIGAGTMELNGANTYSYLTTITGGTLRVNGSLTASRVVVKKGGTLGGTGLISLSVTNEASGHIAPGRSIGTLTNGTLTLQAGSLLDFEFLGSSLTNDQIVVNGSGGLVINGGAFNLFEAGTTNAWNPVDADATYNLIRYSGVIGGAGISALSVTNGNPAWNFSFDTDGTWVRLKALRLEPESGIMITIW